MLVRSGMGLYEVVRGSTEWYGVVRGGMMLYIWGGAEWYGMVRVRTG